MKLGHNSAQSTSFDLCEVKANDNDNDNTSEKLIVDFHCFLV